MDLVLLLAEISDKDDWPVDEPGKEYFLRDYTSSEIEQALLWISSKRDLCRKDSTRLYGSSSLRVLGDWERIEMGEEACNYLFKLHNLRIVDGFQMEKILSDLSTGQRHDLQDIKALACSVIFDLQSDEAEEDSLDEINYKSDVN